MMDWTVTDTEQANKKRKEMSESQPGMVEVEEDEAEVKIKGVLKDVSQLTCRNTRSIAHLEGAMFRAFRTKKDDPVIVAAIQAGKAYTEATKGKKGHNMGSPHLHVAAAVLRTLCTQQGANVEKLQNFMTTFASQKLLSEAIPTLYVAKQYDETKYKIVWMDTSATLPVQMGTMQVRIFEEELRGHLERTGAEELVGTAPKTPAERRLNKFLGKKKQEKGGA